MVNVIQDQDSHMEKLRVTLGMADKWVMPFSVHCHHMLQYDSTNKPFHARTHVSPHPHIHTLLFLCVGMYFRYHLLFPLLTFLFPCVPVSPCPLPCLPFVIPHLSVIVQLYTRPHCRFRPPLAQHHSYLICV